MTRTDDDLLAEVNRSGFPLQIGVEQLFRQQETSAGWDWNVRYVEHEWRHEQSGALGYADIVIENSAGRLNAVLECKRVQNAEWIFLHEQSSEAVTRTKGFFSAGKDSHVFGWEGIHTKLSSIESQFCVVIGEASDKTRPMLERVSATLVQAVEALAQEDSHYELASNAKMYFPVIVTTARLKLCSYEAGKIELTTGSLRAARMQDAQFVRFRKQLSAEPGVIAKSEQLTSRLVAAAKESTVFVVNIDHLKHFFRYFALLDEESIRKIQDRLAYGRVPAKSRAS